MALEGVGGERFLKREPGLWIQGTEAEFSQEKGSGNCGREMEMEQLEKYTSHQEINLNCWTKSQQPQKPSPPGGSPRAYKIQVLRAQLDLPITVSRAGPRILSFDHLPPQQLCKANPESGILAG